MKRTGFKQKKTVPMKRTKLKKISSSSVAVKKRKIQHLLRFISIYRDGGCLLRNKRNCDGAAVIVDNKVVSSKVIQFDHLITRANNATYADSRLGVCICSGCHFWKKYNEKEYDDLVKTVLEPWRIELWDKMEMERRSHRPHKVNWNTQIELLKKELTSLEY